MNMRKLQKKRVSWASDVNLCQIRMFLSEESPSQVGLNEQDHLQAKTSWLLHSNGVGSDDNLPPGFEGAHPANQLKNMLSQMPVIKWKYPPKFVLDATWQVVAGEESKEVELQSQREMRVLEAIYPRPSAIPPNPAFSVEKEDCHHDGRQALLIPITPIEDEDAAGDASYDSMVPINIPINSQPPFVDPGIISASQCSSSSSVSNPPHSEKSAAGKAIDVEPDVAAAASAAFTAIMKTNEQGNMIDRELLIKILNNPKLIEKLVTDYGAASNPQTIPMPVLPPVIVSDPPLTLINRMENGTSSSAVPANGPFQPQPNGAVHFMVPRPTPPGSGMVSVSSQSSVGASKDFNYYKTLIQQHGGERQEAFPQYGNHHSHQFGANQESLNNQNPRDLKPRIMKPCIYFNSSRGCRHGANCAYQHDASLHQRVNSMQDVQSAKRMKLDREITGS